MNYKHEIIEYTNKNETLSKIIKDNGIKKALIFCNKKQDIEKISLFFNDELKLKTFGIYNGVDEDFKTECVKKFNTNKNIFLACSDSIAKKIIFKEKVDFFIATELPTRAYDYKKRMLNYLNEGGQCWTLSSGKNSKQLQEIEKILNPELKIEKATEKDIIVKEAAKENIAPTPVITKKEIVDNKIENKNKETSKSGCPFKGNIPAFLKLNLKTKKDI
jgi:superfamily II DNA/RNA helicase